MKPIRLTTHAAGYLQSRGFTMPEVQLAIRTTQWGYADLGRQDCRKDFSFEAAWNGRHYATKQVRPVFVEEADEIVVITVYTYYF